MLTRVNDLLEFYGVSLLYADLTLDLEDLIEARNRVS